MIRLPTHLRRDLEQVVGAAYPSESCGVLVGQVRAANGRDGQPHTEVVRFVQLANLEAERAGDRYTMDPDGLLAADEAARAARLEIVGVWHSHPDHPAQPSATDRKAAWIGWSYVIASVGPSGVTEVRSWRLAGEQFVEEPLQ